MPGASLLDTRDHVGSEDGTSLAAFDPFASTFSGTRRNYASTEDARQMSNNKKVRTTIVGSGSMGRFEDIFYDLLEVRWWQFVCIMFIAYVVLSSFFAALYALEADCIDNAHDFGSILFYSMQVMFGTTYGDGTPLTSHSKVLTVVQMFASAISIAVGTGIIFTRLSMPTSQLIFANSACISEFEGVPALSFRLANRRPRSMLMDVSVSAGFVTHEGESSWQRNRVLDMIHPFMISATAQLRHRITEDSPLYGMTPETIRDRIPWLYIYVTGVEETFGNSVFVKKVYSPEDIFFDHQFVDMVYPNAPGAKTRVTMQFDKLHDLRRVPEPRP